MVRRLLTLAGLLVIGLLAACNGNAGGNQPPVQVDNASLIEWDRSPSTVVFRADVTGGNPDPLLARSELPACTLYGDNHAVWTNELGPFEVQVLEDRLTDDQMRTFVNFVALNEQIYKYPARKDDDPASAVTPVVESLALFVNNVNHVTDAFSGWDIDYYQRLLKGCKDISLAPAIYEPTAAWISAQAIPYDPTSPGVLWDPQANNLSLADLAASGERKWITDRNVRVIWKILRTSPPSVQLTENDISYHVALEVPNITRESPAAPAS
ncbi:MAG TPA: hypothetical protein VLK33_11725 [Terriglobales bacterium]|nr:hypothetical protein [Terriglobales bacterium]